MDGTTKKLACILLQKRQCRRSPEGTGRRVFHGTTNGRMSKLSCGESRRSKRWEDKEEDVKTRLGNDADNRNGLNIATATRNRRSAWHCSLPLWSRKRATAHLFLTSGVWENGGTAGWNNGSENSHVVQLQRNLTHPNWPVSGIFYTGLWPFSDPINKFFRFLSICFPHRESILPDSDKSGGGLFFSRWTLALDGKETATATTETDLPRRICRSYAAAERPG